MTVFPIGFPQVFLSFQAAEELLNRQLAMQAKKSKEGSALNAKNQELSAAAERLAEELYEETPSDSRWLRHETNLGGGLSQAEAELASLKQRRQALEDNRKLRQFLCFLVEVATFGTRQEKLAIALSMQADVFSTCWDFGVCAHSGWRTTTATKAARAGGLYCNSNSYFFVNSADCGSPKWRTFG